MTNTVVERIVQRVRPDGSVGPALDTAFALSALTTLDGPADARAALAEALRGSQLADGSWERSIFYYGGPNEVFGWASEALSTASALQALVRHERTATRMEVA